MFSPLKKAKSLAFIPPPNQLQLLQKHYERGKERLQVLGFTIQEGFLTGKEVFYRSGTPKERAEELNALLRDPHIKMILPTMGGTNANSMLPYLDYEAFK